MNITSAGIENGYWADRFGKHGSQFNAHGTNNRSVPFSISDAPAGTKSFAVVLDDWDAVPVCGFCWIHWTLCNLTETEVPENASISAPAFLQGCTSQHSAASSETREEASFYGGMAPPDAEHEYGLTVYALDCMLDLEPGFYLNELRRAMRGHILSHKTIFAKYRP
jgi:hypothetical protein